MMVSLVSPYSFGQFVILHLTRKAAIVALSSRVLDMNRLSPGNSQRTLRAGCGSDGLYRKICQNISGNANGLFLEIEHIG